MRGAAKLVGGLLSRCPPATAPYWLPPALGRPAAGFWLPAVMCSGLTWCAHALVVLGQCVTCVSSHVGTHKYKSEAGRQSKGGGGRTVCEALWSHQQLAADSNSRQSPCASRLLPLLTAASSQRAAGAHCAALAGVGSCTAHISERWRCKLQCSIIVPGPKRSAWEHAHVRVWWPQAAASCRLACQPIKTTHKLNNHRSSYSR
jgi:hypothetical protein